METKRYFIKKDYHTADIWLYTTDFGIGVFKKSGDLFIETDQTMYLNAGSTGLLHEWVPKSELIEIKEEIYYQLMQLSNEFSLDDLSMGSPENARKRLNETIHHVLNEAGIRIKCVE